MGIIGRLFGGKSDLEKMQQALQQRSYVEALHLGEDLLAAGETSDALSAGIIEASDGLARLNLDEGVRSLQAGNFSLATEHLELAKTQARSAELIAEIEIALTQSPEEERPQSEEKTTEGLACGSCAPTPFLDDVATDDFPDLHSQFELIIASYPQAVQQRYLEKSKSFLKAFLMVHNGEDKQALPFWEEVPREERDDLYLFEVGCLYARLGENKRGIALLKQALDAGPGNGLVIDALLSLLLEQGDASAAHKLLQKQLDAGANPAFCYARQTELHAASHNSQAAFDSARKALGAGYAEPGFMVLAAGLFEAAGQDEDAEKMLSGLSGGGCGGGMNLHLAEFLLRKERELGKVLDAFNAACRQEPENPRWQLRVAQTYLARNWRKQGLEILGRVVGDPRLDDVLRLEAEQLLANA